MRGGLCVNCPPLLVWWCYYVDFGVGNFFGCEWSLWRLCDNCWLIHISIYLNVHINIFKRRSHLLLQQEPHIHVPFLMAVRSAWTICSRAMAAQLPKADLCSKQLVCSAWSWSFSRDCIVKINEKLSFKIQSRNCYRKSHRSGSTLWLSAQMQYRICIIS